MARVFIKRRSDPITLSEERAQSLKKSWLDVENVPRNTPVDIGVWAGEIGQIAQFETEEEKRANAQWNKLDELNSREIAKLEGELKGLERVAIAKLGKPFYSELFWLEANKAIRLEIKHNPDGKAYYTMIVKSPTLYEQLRGKLDQLHDHQARKAQGSRAKLVALDEVKESVGKLF